MALGKSDRFYSNPSLRDAEWNQATTPPAWQVILTLLVVAGGFIVGVYADNPMNRVGWVIGCLAIAIYFGLAPLRRQRARQRLRRTHGQDAS